MPDNSGVIYAVQLGHLLKVGRTGNPATRLATYKREARKWGVDCRVLYVSSRHKEAIANERAVLDRFRPAGQRGEYLADVDSTEVVQYMQGLACTPPAAPGEGSPWVSAAIAAELVGVSMATLDRYALAGYVEHHRNSVTRRVSYHIDQLAALRLVRDGKPLNTLERTG